MDDRRKQMWSRWLSSQHRERQKSFVGYPQRPIKFGHLRTDTRKVGKKNQKRLRSYHVDQRFKAVLCSQWTTICVVWWGTSIGPFRLLQQIAYHRSPQARLRFPLLPWLPNWEQRVAFRPPIGIRGQRRRVIIQKMIDLVINNIIMGIKEHSYLNLDKSMIYFV